MMLLVPPLKAVQVKLLQSLVSTISFDFIQACSIQYLIQMFKLVEKRKSKPGIDQLHYQMVLPPFLSCHILTLFIADEASAKSVRTETNLRNRFPFAFLAGQKESVEDNFASYLDELSEHLDQTAEPEDEENALLSSGIVEIYLTAVKDTVDRAIQSQNLPSCYASNGFFIRPGALYFEFKKARHAQTLDPSSAYLPSVFVWLPNELGESDRILCMNEQCKKQGCVMTSKGWNSSPVARRVIGLSENYYILTKRIQCKECRTSMNYYDPRVMKQLSPELADEFPAFLTQRSGIDKELMELIRDGMSLGVNSNMWATMIRTAHVRKHALSELKYCHAAATATAEAHAKQIDPPKFDPFSAFSDKKGYNGHYPSRWYINSVYVDYIQRIRPMLDQYMSALTGYILKWDHSFKVPKFLMKINGEPVFQGLFTVVNEFEQIRYQAFVPTKAQSHIREGLEGIVKSLRDHGLPEPVIGYTDVPASDMSMFTECFPSLKENVAPIQLDEYGDLPQLQLPDDVKSIVCSTEQEIQQACRGIQNALTDHLGDLTHLKIYVGFDMEWDFTTGPGASGPQKTALIQIAHQKSVYLLRVYGLKALPKLLVEILQSTDIIKIGRNIAADMAKLARDFPNFEPNKVGNKLRGVIELGKLAVQKNAVSNANASLAAITAATLQKHLSKEMRISEWSTILSEEQIAYAALDAYVAWKIWDVLKQVNDDVGSPLSGFTTVGQEVSLYARKQEIAQGVVAVQPAIHQFVRKGEKKSTKIRVATTKTRALITITKVIAPRAILPLYDESLEVIQNSHTGTFDVVVNISSLRNRGSSKQVKPNALSQLHKELDPASLVIEKPPTINEQSSEIDAESDNEDSEGEIPEDIKTDLDSHRYKQGELSGGAIPTRIYADVFHEQDKVCRTVSKKHSLFKRFAKAFSRTMLIPDAVDKQNISAVLEKKGSSWEKALAKQPDWVWRRCRRYIPPKDILFRNMQELFNCWGPTICSKTGQPLFVKESWKKAKAVLHDIQLGWLSDPDNIPLYVQEKKPDRNGLNIYHCLRGTNSCEGSVHNPIHKMFGSLNASPELADALVADWRHRHNIEAGSKHKFNTIYTGHYDPWLDFALQKLKEDILWESAPSNPLQNITSDTNPLAFSATEEKFGIPKIPPVVRMNAGFELYDGPSYSAKDGDMLVINHLSGRRRDIYVFLAEAQDTKFAVTPFHTEQEFDCFNKAVSAGGEWCPSNGTPNFDSMVKWWSKQAQGTHNKIFYKLREHLASYWNVWMSYQYTRSSLISSSSLRKPNESRVHSTDYVSYVLPAASRTHPGVRVTPTQPQPIDDVVMTDSLAQEPVSEDVVMASSEISLLVPQNNLPITASLASSSPPRIPQVSTWQSTDFRMYAPKRALSTSFSSVTESFQQPQPTFTHNIAESSTHAVQSFQTYAVWKTPFSTPPLAFVNTDQSGERKTRRKCKICGQTDCPGSQNRAKCKNT